MSDQLAPTRRAFFCKNLGLRFVVKDSAGKTFARLFRGKARAGRSVAKLLTREHSNDIARSSSKNPIRQIDQNVMPITRSHDDGWQATIADAGRLASPERLVVPVAPETYQLWSGATPF